MTDISELLHELRDKAKWVDPDFDIVPDELLLKAADALERCSEQIDELRAQLNIARNSNGFELLEKARADAAEKTIDVLESNARVQAALLADTGRALADIDKIVHTPTRDTRHRAASDHFQADFDAIRKLTAPFRADVSGVKE